MDPDVKLARILATREIMNHAVYPYQARFIDAANVDKWLEDNCTGRYKITARFNGRHTIHFEQNADFTLYTLIWYE